MPDVILVLVFLLAGLLCVRAAAGRWPGLVGGTVEGGRRTGFACRVEPTVMPTDDGSVEVLAIQMCGRIQAPRNRYDTNVQVLIADVTEGTNHPQPVLCTDEAWQMEDSPAFCLVAHNGPIPRRVAVLANWVRVATIPCGVLVFPHRGVRRLQFVVSLHGRRDGRMIASASTLYSFTNARPGYLDERDVRPSSSPEPIEVLMLRLAVGVCQNDGGVPDVVVGLLREWIVFQAQEAIAEGPERDAAVECLESGLDEALRRAQAGSLDVEGTADKLAREASIVDRYQAAGLVLQAVGAEQTVLRHRTDRLMRIAGRLGIDREKFRAMAQKCLPMHTHRVEDMCFLLGIEAEMDAAERRQRLNQEYQKWNARVTHPDAAIRQQADRMLTLIAEARSRLADEPTVVQA